MEVIEEDVKVGDIVDGMCIISVCDNLLLCEGITLFDRGEEDEEEGCLIGTLEEVDVWERYEEDWNDVSK